MIRGLLERAKFKAVESGDCLAMGGLGVHRYDRLLDQGGGKGVNCIWFESWRQGPISPAVSADYPDFDRIARGMPMIGRRIFSGSTFEELAGYARAVVLPDPGGDWVLISGTTGFDYKTMTIAEIAEAQTHQCFANIAAALEQAELTLSDVVQLKGFIADAADFDVIAPIVGQYMRPARPTNTTVITQLVDPRMKIEIEITARGAPKS